MSTLTSVRAVRSPIELARSLADDEGRWLPRVRFDPGERVAVRLGSPDDTWEAWLLTWLPGQGTGLHDHGGATGAFVVLRGSLQETVLVPAGDARFRPVSLQWESPAVRSFGRRHVHEVLNVSETPAVSLHVYAPALTTMTRYRLDGDGRLDVLTRERAGTDW